MTAPFVPIAAAFMLGVLVASCCSIPVATLSALGLGCVLVSAWRNAASWLRTIALLVLWVCVGMLNLSQWSHRPLDHIATRLTEAPRHLMLHGMVVDDPAELFAPNEPERQIAVVQVLHVRDADREPWRPATGLVRVRLREPRVALAYGDEVLLEGKLADVLPAGNPGQFDWRAALARQRIHALLSVEPYHGVAQLRSHQGQWWFRAVYALRHRLESLIDAHFSPDHAGLLRSFLLGQRVALDEDLKQAFIETGTMHLVVISGFNVGLIAGLLELVLRLVGLPLAIRLGLSAIGLGGYCILTGMQPPVTRATIMAWVVLGAMGLGRVMSWPNALAAAALVILWVNPAQLWDPGFQLSFGAVMSLLVFAARLQTGLEPRLRIGPAWLQRYLAIGLASTVAIWLGLWPLLAWYFHLVSPISMVANLLLVPMVSLLVSTGTIVLMTGVVVEPVVRWARAGLQLLLQAIISSVQWCHAVPLGWWSLGHPSWLVIGGYYALLVMSILRSRVRWPLGRLIACWLIGLNLWIWGSVGARLIDSRWLEVTVLDVGHGDSIVIRTPSQHTLLVDAGTLEAGRYAVLPFLQFRGWQKLDALILTHPDEDHVGGALPLLQALQVRRLFTNGATGTTPTAQHVAELAQARHVRAERLAAGAELAGPSGARLVVLHPPRGFVPGTAPASNHNSLVLQVTKGDVGLLFCGDVEDQGVPWLVQWGSQLRSSVLKVPHHGSALGKWQQRFLELVHPSIAIISVGRLHHLPAAEVMEDLDAIGAKVFLTRRDGAITIRTDGERLIMHTGRKVE